MKKQIIRYGTLVCILLLLMNSCAAPYGANADPKNEAADSGQEAVTYAETPPENSLYTIERGEGVLYLHVRDSEAVADWRSIRFPAVSSSSSSTWCVLEQYVPIADYVTFLTVSAMQDRILNYKLTEDELRRLYLFFADTQDRIVLMDLYRMTDLSLPVDLTHVEIHCGAPLFIQFEVDQHTGTLYEITAEEYEKELSTWMRGPSHGRNMTVGYDEDRNASVYDYMMDFDYRKAYRRVVYTVEKDGIQYNVIESYKKPIDEESFPDVPDDIMVLYEGKGQYYKVYLYFIGRPSVEWLTSFGLAYTE